MKQTFAPIILIAMLAFAGCGTRIHSTVTRFNDLPHQGISSVYSFLPSEKQQGSLEYASYCREVEAQLSRHGWKRAGEGQEADLMIFMDYGIDDGETVTGSLPIFGQTGGGTSTTYGTVRTNYGTSATYTGTTYTPMTFGQVGAIPYRRKEYDRFLFLSIIDSQHSSEKTLVKVFEGRVLSSGSSEEISMVLPTMIKALFKKFPGENGKSEKVTLPMR